MLESSHAWLGASTSSLAADSYQYQLQSMWQKCWNTNQSLVHNLRFRERGPLKSWRPETMAEAILSVLKEGLSLSQAARKYDIPYPTFVLYANRVHNMLGPSADGGSDLRPKGRGRPQRILLGIWPEEHIRGVIRAVVFRDPQHIKEEPTLNLAYHRLPEVVHNYSTSASSGPGSGGSGPGSVAGSDGGVSPNSAAAAVVAVAQNLRQQMLAAAAHHHHQAAVQQQQQQLQHQQQLQQQQMQQQQQPTSQQQTPQQQHHQQQQLHQQSQLPQQQQHHHHPFLGVSPLGPPEHHHPVAAAGFGFLAAAAAAHCANGTNLHPSLLHSPSPVDSSPRSSPLTQPNNNMEMGLNLGFKPMVNDSLQNQRNEHLFQDEIEDLVKRPQPSDTPKIKSSSMSFQATPNDLSMRADHLFQDDMETIMKRAPVSEPPKVKVGIGVSGMTYKASCEGYMTASRPESLFQEDIEDLVKSPPPQTNKKDSIHLSAAVDQRTD